MRAGFFRVRVQGLDRLRAAQAAEPGRGGTLFVANHSCWWDVFFAHLLNVTLPVDGYGMMIDFNLRRFGFFRRIGAFSVDPGDPASVRAALGYAAGLLRRDGVGVWIFPQGRIAGNDARPLGFRPGLRPLLRRASPVRVVPVAFRYEFWQDERPEAFARLGEPSWVERNDAVGAVEVWERRLADELDALRADVTAQAAERFATVLQGSESISDRYARFRARLRGSTPGAPGASP